MGPARLLHPAAAHPLPQSPTPVLEREYKRQFDRLNVDGIEGATKAVTRRTDNRGEISRIQAPPQV